MNIKISIFVILICLVIPLNVNANSNLSEDFQTELHSAKVIEIIEEKKYNESTIQTLEIEITKGEYKGQKDIINNTLTNNENDIDLKKGDNINVILSMDEEEVNFYFHSYDKTNYLILLILIFVIFILVIGKIKGLKALISLIITILLIIFGFIPLLLNGFSPVLLSILTCILATVITFTITNGFTKKTFIAIIGVIGGLLVAGIITFIFSEIMHLTGVAGESEQMLYYIPGDITFDFKGLLFAGIIIGALGACMDVAMEITSSLYEIKYHTPKIKDNDLIKSGFNIGKDIMGTMVNTLILAYTGSSIPMLLLFMGFEKSFNEIINLESITTELLRAISGSIGLLLTIPITIYIFVLFNKKKGKKTNEKAE